MFEKILNELKTNYKHLGLSEKILKVQAKKLARTVKEESEIAEAIASVEPDLELFQSFQDQNRTLQKELEALKEGNKAKGEEKPKTQEPKKEPTPEEQMPAWAKALLETNKNLSEKLTAFEQERQAQNAKKTFEQKAKELNINERFYKSHAGRTFKDNEEMDEFLNLLKEDQDAFKKALNEEVLKNHTKPIFGGKIDDKDGESEDMKAFLEEEKSKNESNQ